jgi:hypothetical protein
VQPGHLRQVSGLGQHVPRRCSHPH